MHIFDIIALFIFLSALFIFINTYYLKLPSPVGLMILALVLSLLVLAIGTLFPGLHLAEQVKEYDFQEVLYQFVLSVMLFAGALSLDFNRLKGQKLPIFVLSTIGVLISTFIIGTLVYYMLDLMNIDLGYLYCLVFAALISSTDPIAITKTINRFAISKELEIKVAGEALISGGLAVVLSLAIFNLAQANAEGALTFGGGSLILLRDLGGGVLSGLIFGYIGIWLLKTIDNDQTQVEVLITLALVMAGSLASDFMGVSSKMAAIVMGLLIRNTNVGGESVAGGYVFKFWKLLEESMAAMLFVLIGLEMLVIPWRLDFFAAGFFAVNIVLLGRWVSVFIPIKLMSMGRAFAADTISILTWGALRGGLPIALSLSMPAFHGKDIILTMTYVVVVCSVLYQGFSLPTLMRANYVKN